MAASHMGLSQSWSSIWQCPPHKSACRMESLPRQHPEGSTECASRGSEVQTQVCFWWRRLLNTQTHTHRVFAESSRLLCIFFLTSPISDWICFDSHQLPVCNSVFASINRDRAGDRDWLPHPPCSCATACLCPLGLKWVLSPFHTAAVLPAGRVLC